MEQLDLIFKLCGSPGVDDWPDFQELPWSKKFTKQKPFPRRTHEVFRRFPLSARILVDGLLALNPRNRISAKDALDSDYFWEEPMPCGSQDLPKYEPSHEFQTRKRRQLEVNLNQVFKPSTTLKPADEKFETQSNEDYHQHLTSSTKYGGYIGSHPPGSWSRATARNRAKWARSNN